MSNDELFKAFGMLKEGFSQYQIARATNDANEQIKSLQMQELERGQALQAQSQIQNDLALRLTAAGANPGQIQAATENIAPSMGAQFQAEQNAELQKSGQDWKSNEAALDRDLQRELAYASINANKSKAGRKLDEREIAFLQKNQAAFDSQAKKAIGSLEQLNVVKEALSANNPVADASVINFMARASGEVGALTEADKAPFGGSQAYAAKLKQAVANAKSGRFTPENRAFLKQLAATYEKVQKRNLMEVRAKVSKRAAKAAKIGGYDLDEDQIAQTLYTIEDEPQTAGGGAAAKTQPQAPAGPQPSFNLNQYVRD